MFAVNGTDQKKGVKKESIQCLCTTPTSGADAAEKQIPVSPLPVADRETTEMKHPGNKAVS